MNLMVDPILTPTEDKKDANKASALYAKTRENRPYRIEIRNEIRNGGGRLSIGRVMGRQKRYYIHIP